MVEVKAQSAACVHPVKPWLQAPVHEHRCAWVGAWAPTDARACACECMYMYVAGVCAHAL